MRTACTFLVVAAMWLPPVLAFIANRTKPDIGTALGVPYAVLAGLILGAVVTAVFAIASLRWPALRPRFIVICFAGVISLVLLFLADRGMLSVVR